jgi:hypothetical protein
MKPGPAWAAAIIAESIPLSHSPVEVSDLLTTVIVSQGWAVSSDEGREIAERWQETTLKRLRDDFNSLAALGRPTRYCFNSSSEYYLQGVCFEEPADIEEVRKSKQRRHQSEKYEDALRLITPRQLEVLCGRLMGLFGVDKPVVTRAAADEGIDFYGHLKLESLLYPGDLLPTIQKQLTVWLVGQAKHYQRVQSGTEELRSLAGSVVLGRQGAFGSRESPLSGLEIRPFDPVFAMFVTTGTMSANAWRLLSRSGVIGVDGSMLAAFLADRAVGHVNGALDIETFKRWLAGD